MVLRKIFFTLFLFSLFLSAGFAEQVWEFNYDKNGWEAYKDIAGLKSENGGLAGQSNGLMPLLASPSLYFEAAENDTLEFRLKATEGTGRILWIGTFDTQFNPQKQVEFKVKNGLHTYYINLRSQNPLWDGSISKIFFSPSSSPGNFEIDCIKLKQGTIITNFLSALSEFFGPKGRAITGSTVNNIPNSQLFGRPATFYIYWMIFIGFMIFLASGPKKSAGKKTVMLLLFFWIMLELNSLYNQFGVLKEDSRLIGKSLEEKHAAVTDPDFYSFLSFCNKNLPPRSKYVFKTSSAYFQSKASYYLFPNIQNETGAYLLVYKEEPVDRSQYTLFAKYKEGEYILKCN